MINGWCVTVRCDMWPGNWRGFEWEEDVSMMSDNWFYIFAKFSNLVETRPILYWLAIFSRSSKFFSPEIRRFSRNLVENASKWSSYLSISVSTILLHFSGKNIRHNSTFVPSFLDSSPREMRRSHIGGQAINWFCRTDILCFGPMPNE